MNNLNDPDWNIKPGQGAGGDNSKYALLVPMGLAAFGWLWSKKSQLKQDLERERKSVAILKAQKTAFLMALDEKSQKEQTVMEALQKVEEKLVERQSTACSILHPPEKNLLVKLNRDGSTIWSIHELRNEKDQAEKDLQVMADQPALTSLGMKKGLGDIFAYDTTCAVDHPKKENNGSLMWVYLDHWRLLVELQRHQRAKAYLMSSESAEK